MSVARNKKRIFFILAASILAAVIAWIVWGNTALELNVYTIINDDLPLAFDGYRIAHVSDLHNAEMGDGNVKLLGMLRDADPDIIAITGDLIDSRNTNVEIALDFAEQAVEIAPCYYVTGNHEARSAQYNSLKAGLLKCGVTVLENERIVIDRSGSKISLIGVNDPSFGVDYLFGDAETLMQFQLNDLLNTDAAYNILLSHRPELFEIYTEQGIDLILSGHAHGGQFRLPLIGGVIAPNQGLFPEFDAGVYSDRGTQMVVSRGIGNSIIPFRINNNPELVLIKLGSQLK